MLFNVIGRGSWCVGNENKNLVLGYFGTASKFWARFQGFWGGVGKKAAARKEKKYAAPFKKYRAATQ